MVSFYYEFSCFVERSELNANSVDPNQTPRSVAADLGLHCLPMSLLWDAGLKWFNNQHLLNAPYYMMKNTQLWVKRLSR